MSDGPQPVLIEPATLAAMGGRAQAHADARRLARIAPDLLIPQVADDGD